MRINRLSILIMIIFFSSILLIHNLMQTIKEQKSDITSTIFSLEEKIDELNETLAIYEKSLKEANTRIEFLEHKDNYWNEMSGEYTTEIAKLWHLVKRIPQLTTRMAFIKQIDEERNTVYVTLDYAEWFSGDEAVKAASEDNYKDVSLPNGFYIRNNKIEQDKVKIEQETLIYVLEGSRLEYIEYNDFKSYLKSPNEKLFWFYEIENKVVLMMEQYRP